MLQQHDAATPAAARRAVDALVWGTFGGDRGLALSAVAQQLSDGVGRLAAAAEPGGGALRPRHRLADAADGRDDRRPNAVSASNVDSFLSSGTQSTSIVAAVAALGATAGAEATASHVGAPASSATAKVGRRARMGPRKSPDAVANGTLRALAALGLAAAAGTVWFAWAAIVSPRA